LTTPRATLISINFSHQKPAWLSPRPHLQTFLTMANPKRKQSKRRSANRRAANAFQAPEFAKDPVDGSTFRPHRVNPKNGMYRGRQVLDVSV
jgi:large subunit ribosomal protein L32